MESNTEGNLLEIMDLARTLRQEQLFIQQEQAAFGQLTETMSQNSAAITKLAYICAQQRQNLNDLILSRPETGPLLCCRRANSYENAKFVDAKKVMDYEHAIAYEELFNHLYRSPYLLALSLATGDRIPEITPQHISSVIHTISTGLYGNAINTKDVEMVLKLLRELIEIQIVVSENPRRLLRANSSAFARLYHRLNESMFSAKIFLTAALYEPIMIVLSDSETIVDVDPHKVVQRFSLKERLKRFGAEDATEYQENIEKFHDETLTRLHELAETFIDSLNYNWSLFPSTLRWLVQTMCHHLKHAHFSEKIINEIITDMVFTHYICPAIVSPDVAGIIDAPISEQVRFNLVQIGQIVQMLALAKHDDIDAKFADVYAKFKANMVTKLIDLLLVSQTGEDVVAILSQQSDFERGHLLSTSSELSYFIEFFRILMGNESYDIAAEERQKMAKILAHLPETAETTNVCAAGAAAGASEPHAKEQRSKQSFMSLGKATKSKIAKSMSFSTNGSHAAVEGAVTTLNGNGLTNGANGHHQISTNIADNLSAGSSSRGGSTHSSPVRTLPDSSDNEPIVVFNIYVNDDHKLQPLTEEEVLKMNSIGQEMSNGEALLVDGESCNMENTIDKSSLVNGYDGIDGMSDVLRPLHTKATRFSLSHDDASIGNSDILEAVSEAPSNHSVTSSLELEENDQNDNLSDMVSANVSGRGTPNISGRDTPSSQVTDGESVHNALPTPQMQKLISKARSDIEDKFCKFEIKKFQGDETVSIISDTWSTDVLASDSETLDANERDRDRDRDRNFSTPLIPSAVVLPGDNNFDALSGAGTMRPGYLDVSDQRSESNWSTDVLASDSEKLAEIDTDDNVSITAKSDTTDAGLRTDQERDILAASISAAPREHQRTLPSGFYHSRAGRNLHAALADHYSGVGRGCGDFDNVAAGGAGVGGVCGGGGGGDSGDHGSGGSSGGNASDRSQEDSAFYDAINLYEDVVAAVSGGVVGGDVVAAGAAAESGNGLLDTPASLRHYQGPSSLARSSVRTTNQYSGENNFQQNYKCGNNNSHHNNSNNSSNVSNDGKEPFLGTPRMHRQMSAESSISNQSFNLEEAGAAAGKPPPKSHHHKAGTKKKRHSSNNTNGNTPSTKSSDSKDLIDFSDFGEEKPSRRILPAENGGEAAALIEIFSDEALVEHRRISTEQRSAGFDGRRNGIMAAVGDGDGGADGGNRNNSIPALRRHQSLNYENHEIMLNNILPSRASAMPHLKYSSQTDDDKSKQQQQQQQQHDIMMLCTKTEGLELNVVDNVPLNSDYALHKATPINKTCSVNTTTTLTSSVVVAPTSTQSTKPTKSTGAIPKSISFDASADKNSTAGIAALRPISTRSSRLQDANVTLRNAMLGGPSNSGGGGGGSGGGGGGGGANSGIINKIKYGIFKNRGKSHNKTHSHAIVSSTAEELSQSSRSVSFSTNTSEVSLEMCGAIAGTAVGGGVAGIGRSASGAGAVGYCDITEDILAKYRRKVSSSSEATNSDSTGGAVGVGGGISSSGLEQRKDLTLKRLPSTTIHDKALAFNIIKKKIRTVLSKTDLHTGDFRHTTYSNASPLLTYLQIQLAQATNLQNFQQISYVSEAIRCILSLEPIQHAQLLDELQKDIQKRQNYLQYLMRYRQNLLLIMENIGQFELRLHSENATCNRNLMAVCVRLFFEKRQRKFEEFQEEFARLTVSDDKIDLIEEFIEAFMEELLANGGILHDAQAQEARFSIERILLQRMYQQVMFPNEDADLSRDSVLSEHIRKLQGIIRPSHAALCIPQEYLAEAPWPFAQQQLSYITAYKTPREKLQCVIRCISSIMSLLQMSSGRIPAADDILPVLIYVVIMANPPFLLSTVEYISCFIGDKLEGEEQFHWTLFGSVVKFIKTMDY